MIRQRRSRQDVLDEIKLLDRMLVYKNKELEDMEEYERTAESDDERARIEGLKDLILIDKTQLEQQIAELWVLHDRILGKPKTR